MPKFIDYHEKLPTVTPEMAAQMKSVLEAGQPDEFGSKGLNIFMTNTGSAYCLSEAPNAEAVVKPHEAKGLSLSAEHVVEVNSVI